MARDPDRLPDIETLDPAELKRFADLEDRVRDRLVDLAESLDGDEDGGHLLGTVLIAVAYGLLEECGYDPRAVMERFLRTIEDARSGDLVFVDADRN